MGDIEDGKIVEHRDSMGLGFARNDGDIAQVGELRKDVDPGWYIYVCEDWTGQSSGHIKRHVLRFKLGMPVQWDYGIWRADKIARRKQIAGWDSVKLREMARDKWSQVRDKYLAAGKSQRVE